MSMFENFPYTNLHELNLDWLVQQLKQMTDAQVLSVNGMTGVVTLYENAAVQFPSIAQDSWSMLRLADGTTRGIYFANDNTAFILHGNTMSEIYSQNNQPPYPVTRVNGLYGDVELYTDQYVRLPDLTDAQMTNWTFFRILNGTSHGIQFNDDGTAQIINGTSRYTVYTSDNPPPYPVSSVNGQTGTVVLFSDVNAAVSFPAVTDAGIEAWSLERNVNGTVYGLRLNDDGTLTLKVGASEYTVYTSNDPAPSFVEDDSVEVMNVSEDSPDNFWGITRDTTEGNIGIVFENSDPDDPHAFMAYIDSNDQGQTLQLLTPNDIPASGVVSVNTKSGIVTLYGTDIDVSSGDSRKLDAAIQDAAEVTAYYEPGATASQNYSIGYYVIWNNGLYKVTSNITAGDTLSLSNLSAVTNMGAVMRTAENNISNLQSNKAAYWGAGSNSMSYTVAQAGFLTASGATVMCFYPVAIKPGCTLSSVSLSTATIRGISGYILNNVSDFTPYTVSGTLTPQGVRIQIDGLTGFSSINNTPVTGQIAGTVVLT